MAEEGCVSQLSERARQHEPDDPSQLNSDLLERIKISIDDDDFKVIQRCFNMQGKGRRPSLPKYKDITNKLLVQLHFLKEEQQTSFTELKTWLETLIPHTHNVSESRIYHQIQHVLNKCCSNIDQHVQLLDEKFFPDSLHPSLAALGLTLLHLTDDLPYLEPPQQCVNQDVVVRLEHFRAKQRYPHTFVSKWLRILSLVCKDLNDSKLKTKVGGIMKMYTQVRVSKSKNSDDLQLFNEKLFLMENVLPVSNDNPIINTCSKCKQKDLLIGSLTNELKDAKLINKQLYSKYEIVNSENEINNLTICELQGEKNQYVCDIHELNCTIKDMQSNVSKLKGEVRKEIGEKGQLSFDLNKVKSSTLYKDNSKKNKILNELTNEKDLIIKDAEEKNNDNIHLKEEIGFLKKKIKSEQSMKSKYYNSFNEQKEVNLQLSKMLTFDEVEVKPEIRACESGSSHKYSDGIRNAFYVLNGEDEVAMSKCSKVISTVAKCLFDTDLPVKDLPSQSTALRFGNEADVIAKHHVVEEIKKSDHLTYACDATSRDKRHYLEKHVYLSSGSTLSLGYSEIACDDSDTLLESCIGAFKDLCELYCDGDVDKGDLLKELITKVKALLSDRASVCKLFDQKMAAYKDELLGGVDASTLFLFCNAHFLLALSAAAEDGLGIIEEEVGEKLGRDKDIKFAGWKNKGERAAIRLIRLVASIIGPRCDEKSGCRRDWLEFCAERGIKSTFTSYRSNRFNNVFQNSTALIRHMKDIELFLTTYIAKPNLKYHSILCDLKDVNIITHVSVLSFLHVFLLSLIGN